jgi:hypothetical protein
LEFHDRETGAGMQNLRRQILASHLILVAIMVAAMVYGIFNILHLGGAVDRVLKDNLDSVRVTQFMRQALMETDTGAAFAVTGDTLRARCWFEAAPSRLESGTDPACQNAGEQQRQVGRGGKELPVDLERAAGSLRSGASAFTSRAASASPTRLAAVRRISGFGY